MFSRQVELPFDLARLPTAEGELTLRRSSRARRLALRVHLDGRVEVVVPPGVSSNAVLAFVGRHREWLQRKLGERAVAPEPRPFPPATLELPALDQRFRLHLSAGRGRPRVQQSAPGVLSLSGDASADRAATQRALLVWLTAHLQADWQQRLSTLADEMALRFSRLQLRRQRTRWGSCSSRGVISLNVCAAFQPPEVLRYLMVHELVHLRHMNHSTVFWSSVSERCPDYRRLDRELNRGWRNVPHWVFE